MDEAFIKLQKEGLIYRALRPINWCCSLKSALSDAEVDSVTIGKRTYLNIPGYERPVEFGMIHSYDYPVVDSGLLFTFHGFENPEEIQRSFFESLIIR